MAPPGAENVAIAPGSQALIQILPRLRPPGRIWVAEPTYAEHALAWSTAGHTLSGPELIAPAGPQHRARVTELHDRATALPDVTVLVNPNNPDGQRLAPGTVVDMARRGARRGGWLVVDEAFADVAPELSVASHSGQPGLIVLRSFGKFFGLAGLRLGFALAEPALAARIAEAFGPWPVSGPALEIASAALADHHWITATRLRLAAAAQRLDAVLTRHGLEVIGGTSLYRLTCHRDASQIYQRLGNAGILVRRFENNPLWLRFGLPADNDAWSRLEEALT